MLRLALFFSLLSLSAAGEVAVRLLPGLDPDQVARENGYRNEGEVVPGVFLFRPDGKRSPSDLSPFVTWSAPQVPRRRYKRGIPSDPLYSLQWHLHGTPNVDLDVVPVWETYRGRGVLISVVDDGLSFSHPDFSGKYNASASYDINFDDPDPTPYEGDGHGTAAAGAAAANSNNFCGVGVAPEASVAGVRLIAESISDAQEARALSFANDRVDIYSCSWGPADDGHNMGGMGPLARLAIENSVARGRGGKGTIYVWAGGNGYPEGDNCNYDSYANSRFTVTVGAIDSRGKHPWYGEPCSSLLLVAPGSDDDRYIVTTGPVKKGSPTCYGSFGGTSAACPEAAGVVALVLQARPDLTWRDVQGVLAFSALATDPSDPGWVTNGAGLRHNEKYGFGRLSASSAVRKALSWALLPPYRNASCGPYHPNRQIAPGSSLSLPARLDGSLFVEHVEVYLQVDLFHRGRLAVSLTSPAGTVSHLQLQHNDNNRDIRWTYGSVRCWGERVAGTWKVDLSLAGNSPSGARVLSWSMAVFGH